MLQIDKKIAVFNRKILVVDDNVDIRNEFKNIFETKLHDRSNTQIMIDELDGHIDTARGTNDLREKLFDIDDRPKGELSPKINLKNIFDEGKISIEFQVVYATQGEEAIDLFKKAYESDNPFCLIFMDVKMPPGMDGITCLENIRKIDPNIEAVICTAYSDVSLEDIQKRLGQEGNILFLKKPFTYEEVFQLAFCLTQKWTITQRFKNLLESKEKEILEKNMKILNAAKLATLGEISTGIAHEINNPLSILQGYLEIMNNTLNEGNLGQFPNSQGPLEDLKSQINIKEIIKKSLIAIKRIDKIIKGLKSLARNGESNYFMPITVKEILDETLPFCDSRIQRDHINLNVIHDIDLQTKVRCNPIQISQVLLILINNSIDAICLDKIKWIELKVKLTKETLVFELKDSGPGIPKEIQDKIFRPFFSTKSATTGTGLGLSLAKGIIDAHHGKFYLNSEGENTTFIIELFLPEFEKSEQQGSILGHDEYE